MPGAKRRYHEPGKHCMKIQQYEKYSRQILFRGIGEAGQEKLLGASAVIVGCGALGTVVANLLVRAGVGRLRIVDRDFVDSSNLQRQTLFEEADARNEQEIGVELVGSVGLHEGAELAIESAFAHFVVNCFAQPSLASND